MHANGRGFRRKWVWLKIFRAHYCIRTPLLEILDPPLLSLAYYPCLCTFSCCHPYFNHQFYSVVFYACYVLFFCFPRVSIYRIRQNFRWLKFLPKAHTMYWDKNFTNHASCLPGSCGFGFGGKKFAEKIFTNSMHWRNWQKFLLAKISTYTVHCVFYYVSNYNCVG